MVLNIPDKLSDTLHEIGEIGGEHTYLVGGSVRDLLLDRTNLDIDIVVEGDGLKVAKQLQNRWQGSLQEHSQFGTATVTPANPNKPKVDFVTARSETYQKSGTLPTVEPGTIAEDLQRRDFSINALAMCLEKNKFGTIIDKTGGLEDLKNGVIRVLHNNSYDDDPTRIFRAFRYSARYNFHIDKSNLPLIENAIPLIADLSGERIQNEIDRIFLEDNAQQIIQDLAEVGVYEVIYPEWKISSSLSDDLNVVRQAISWSDEHIDDTDIQSGHLYWMAMFGLGKKQVIPTYHIKALCFRLVLTHQLSRIANVSPQLPDSCISNNSIESIFKKLEIKLSEKTSYEFHNGKWCVVDTDNKETYIYDNEIIYKLQTPMTSYQKLIPVLESLTETSTPSIIYKSLKPYTLEALSLGYMNTKLSDVHRKIIGEYLLNLRKIRPIISGNDLIQWGEKPGANFEFILTNLFHEQLDGNIKSKSEAYTHLCSLRNQ